MRMNGNKSTKWKKALLVTVLFAGCIGILAQVIGSRNVYAATVTAARETFQTPAEAGSALAEAAKSGDQAALSQILGGDANALLTTGDAQTDQAATELFAAKYQQMNRWVEMTDGSRVLYIGADNFAFPVPLAKDPAGQWYFDIVAGTQEVRARDIGRNELLAIDACIDLANAEEAYFTIHNTGEYAQHLISTSGKHDGLYWPSSAAQAPSLLGQLGEFPKSSQASTAKGAEQLVSDGYTLRILTAQGKDAPGGTQNFVVNGKMVRGFAILATPVKYGETGVMTFVMSNNGIVYERNLGHDTIKLAAAITEYSPDLNWSPVQ
ncbi:MAG: DUF2950 family protein [Candidatus Acidiferrum sp.]